MLGGTLLPISLFWFAWFAFLHIPHLSTQKLRLILPISCQDHTVFRSLYNPYHRCLSLRHGVRTRITRHNRLPARLVRRVWLQCSRSHHFPPIRLGMRVPTVHAFHSELAGRSMGHKHVWVLCIALHTNAASFMGENDMNGDSRWHAWF